MRTDALNGPARKAATRRTEGRIGLRTDQKPSYKTIADRLLGDRLMHETTAGSRVRTTHNPLFPINTTLAMTRDDCGRLRRRSWLVSKRARYLRSQLSIFTAYRNYVPSLHPLSVAGQRRVGRS